ncbi:hypothetical protein CAPTEDRAFT_179036 [Capitella teleta]|uniref:Ubiquitin carboxyl-terminal hydrolase n=1 Tax=Capitella teleta TaxID=283909 RepID=R7U4R2_CAPTE|nr:hypothetical protein CAPTEDRAFT_179036 [Capitella teleta]|eukprot:ELT98155.1 hypothetical protein CAPTEDRAFT_179036 [Capitella teleta]
MPTSSTVESPEQASSTGAEAAGPEKSPLQSVYHIKWIYFNESMYPIVTQNENGPCPLLAIMNLLVLQGKIKMPPMIEIVTSGQLMEYLADCIFEHAPKDITEDARLNYEQNMHDAMAVFHKLQTGLDVNVKFTSVSTFEYTSECIVFDLLGIPLYHGWLVDPDSPSEVAAIGNCGYNQLVEKIITQKNSAREELVTEALIAEEFLNRSAAQLTYYGLSELSTTVNDGQLCVFFRNNHFSTLFKRKNELFILVTDQGFLTESNVVWETLSNVEGDGHFVDASFHTYRKSEPSNHTIPSSTIPVGTPQQVDQDYLVALSLQEEQSTASPQPPAAAKDLPPEEAFDSDHELAMRLQAEEDRRANAHQQQMANQQHLSQQHQQRVAQEAKEKKKEKSECTIL